MNKEDTKKAIEVMQAYVDGKKIQARYGSRYLDIDVSLWEWSGSATEYRVKPEPRVIEIKKGDHIEIITHNPEPGIDSKYQRVEGPCKFVEVIDD